MHEQGMSVSEIADNLGVTTEVVDGYLNIVTTPSLGGGAAHASGAKSATASNAVVSAGSVSSGSVSSGTTADSKTKTTPIK
jgi:predicted transcriptional regulator